jgi:hypothetical protein
MDVEGTRRRTIERVEKHQMERRALISNGEDKIDKRGQVIAS